jgi:ATP-dependent DNA helicase RecG
MDYKESETVEWKTIVVEDIRKEVVAFANCNGGKILIGINDQGTVVGVDDPDEAMLQVSNMVRDGIKPDVTMFVRYKTEDIQGKQILTIEVQRGSNRPYYLSKKGMRPEGVYVRQGTSSVPSSDTAIRAMIKETDGDRYEDLRSLTQDLTFQAANAEFSKRNVAFALPQMKTLGLLNREDIYTNVGLLLSDQCSHTIKVAVFQGTDQSVFKDRREFCGSLLQQLNDVYDYISTYNRTQATFDKLRRVDTKDYPEVSIREALLNSLVHRDYSYSASTLIRIYDDRLEFVSLGGLLTGVSLDDILLGLSVCRNPKLANIFYRLELIESCGTGIRKILSAYSGLGSTPTIEATSNAFRMILPNVNYSTSLHADYMETSDQEQSVLNLLKRREYITRKDVEDVLQVAQTTSGRLLRRMVDKLLLQKEGRGKSTRYRLLQKP